MLTYSSGTTGLPKIIPGNHRAFVTLANAALSYPEIRQIQESGIYNIYIYANTEL